MANYLLIVPHIFQREGGLSKNPNDNASAYPVPDGSGYHTNKGVTWKTFTDWASRLGYTATPALFYQMPTTIWGKIFKLGYWDKIWGDNLNSQALADMFVDGTFIGGGFKQIRAVQNFLNTQGYNLVADGLMGPNTLAAINTYTKTKAREKELLDIAFNNQMAHFQSLSDWATFKNGWTDRFQSLYTNGLSLIKKKGSVAVGLVALVAVGFFTYKYFK